MRDSLAVLHEQIVAGPLPQHIALIMDGNGRWAHAQNKSRIIGHRAGTKALKKIVRACGELKISYLTVYTFSSENWGRPQKEVKALMALLVEMVNREVNDLNKSNVRLQTTGNLALLPDRTRDALLKGVAKTENNTGLTLVLALSYGGRDELVCAAQALARQSVAGSIQPDQIDEQMFAENLFQPEIPDPELLIRTGGDMRISNFLLWQIAYAELWFTEALWPDFDEELLCRAIADYQGRERRFGQTSEQVK